MTDIKFLMTFQPYHFNPLSHRAGSLTMWLEYQQGQLFPQGSTKRIFNFKSSGHHLAVLNNTAMATLASIQVLSPSCSPTD